MACAGAGHSNGKGLCLGAVHGLQRHRPRRQAWLCGTQRAWRGSRFCAPEKAQVQGNLGRAGPKKKYGEVWLKPLNALALLFSRAFALGGGGEAVKVKSINPPEPPADLTRPAAAASPRLHHSTPGQPLPVEAAPGRQPFFTLRPLGNTLCRDRLAALGRGRGTRGFAGNLLLHVPLLHALQRSRSYRLLLPRARRVSLRVTRASMPRRRRPPLSS
jgi:hypothetical protein